MKNSRKSFIAPVIIAIIVLFAIGSGIYLCSKNPKLMMLKYEKWDAGLKLYDPFDKNNTVATSTINGNRKILKLVTTPDVVQPSQKKVQKISPNTLPVATTNPQNQKLGSTWYSQHLTATGFTNTGLVWNVVKGSLPPGMFLEKPSVSCIPESPCNSNQETYGAMINGRPQSAGTYYFTVRVVAGNQIAEKSYSLVVNNYSAIEVKNIYPNTSDVSSITGISIFGYGFQQGESVILFTGNGITKQIQPYSVTPDGIQITGAIPRDLPAGIYEVSVINIANGTQKASLNSVRYNLTNHCSNGGIWSNGECWAIPVPGTN